MPSPLQYAANRLNAQNREPVRHPASEHASAPLPPDAATRQLKELQAERRERRKTEMDDAIRLRKTAETKGLPYDPAADNFVYASAEIALESARRDRFEAARQAEKLGFAPAVLPPAGSTGLNL